MGFVQEILAVVWVVDVLALECFDCTWDKVALRRVVLAVVNDTVLTVADLTRHLNTLTIYFPFVNNIAVRLKS